MATTTSLNDSGLLTDVVQPAFKAEHPTITMKIIAVGSGAAIAMAQAGNADVLLVHSPAAELAFMDGGYGTLRLPFAYNYFTIVGPKSDPAKVAGAATAAQAFAQIAAYGKSSRRPGRVRLTGRRLGHEQQGAALWGSAGVTATLAGPDAAARTHDLLVHQDRPGHGGDLAGGQPEAGLHALRHGHLPGQQEHLTIVPLLQKSADLKNLYDVILINQSKFPVVNTAGAEYLASWLVGPEGQTAIATYGKSKYGQALFFPNSARRRDAAEVASQRPRSSGKRPPLCRPETSSYTRMSLRRNRYQATAIRAAM